MRFREESSRVGRVAPGTGWAATSCWLGVGARSTAGICGVSAVSARSLRKLCHQRPPPPKSSGCIILGCAVRRGKLLMALLPPSLPLMTFVSQDLYLSIFWSNCVDNIIVTWLTLWFNNCYLSKLVSRLCGLTTCHNTMNVHQYYIDVHWRCYIVHKKNNFDLL